MGNLFLIFLFGWITSLFAFEDYPYGVNFQVVRQPLLPLDNLPLKRNETAARITMRHMNVWSRQQNYFTIDGEESQAELTLRYGIIDTLSIAFASSYISQGGGSFDSSIERFHSMTGVTQGGRDKFPKNKMNVSYEPFGKYYGILDDNALRTILRGYEERMYPRDSLDPPITLDEIARSRFKDLLFVRRPDLQFEESPEIIALSAKDRMGSGNPRLFFEWDLYAGKIFDRMKLGFQYKFPAQNNYLLGSPGFDRSLFWVGEKRIADKLFAKIGISHTIFGVNRFLSLPLQSNQQILRLSLLYHQTKSVSYFSEYVLGSAPFRNFGRLGKPTHQFSVGFKMKVLSGIWSVGFVEDLINFSVSPDIGLFTSYESFFGSE
ncbi:MAG: DUF3187 family protein [Leptospiraceae bacterium]|nr:DUF3187 family protein [Leptospiraceae bacterium]MCP5513472.1 DUF3187 family protein [Leptospiraceae bacterium]